MWKLLILVLCTRGTVQPVTACAPFQLIESSFTLQADCVERATWLLAQNHPFVLAAGCYSGLRPPVLHGR